MTRAAVDAYDDEARRALALRPGRSRPPPKLAAVVTIEAERAGEQGGDLLVLERLAASVPFGSDKIVPASS